MFVVCLQPLSKSSCPVSIKTNLLALTPAQEIVTRIKVWNSSPSSFLLRWNFKVGFLCFVLPLALGIDDD